MTVRLTPHSRQHDSLIRVAYGSQGTPMDLETNGTVREARTMQLLMGVPAHICAVGLYCKASRAHLRHARAALATVPQRRPKGSRFASSLSLTQKPDYFLNKSECEPVSTNSRTRMFSSILYIRSQSGSICNSLWLTQFPERE